MPYTAGSVLQCFCHLLIQEYHISLNLQSFFPKKWVNLFLSFVKKCRFFNVFRKRKYQRYFHSPVDPLFSSILEWLIFYVTLNIMNDLSDFASDQSIMHHTLTIHHKLLIMIIARKPNIPFSPG